MKLVETIKEMKAYREALPSGLKLGFVPTMGFLHEGHLSLVRASKRENDCTVVSIYVNPSQFGPLEDLSRYPRDLTRDLKLLADAKVDLVFHPDTQQIYPSGYKSWVEVSELSDLHCGASRPGHFRGVATIVLKLMNIVKPHRMYMGSKDFQQTRVLEQMILDLNLDTELVACPIVRESDGLALSSRNSYFDEEQRVRARCLSAAIRLVQSEYKKGQKSASELIRLAEDAITGLGQVDYIQIVDPYSLKPQKIAQTDSRILMAVFIDRVRLIDNAALGDTLS